MVSYDYKDWVFWNLVECECDCLIILEGWELFVELVCEMVLDRLEDEYLVLFFYGDFIL